MPVDIFPYIDIPVVSVVWNYQRPLARRDGKAHGHHLRALHDHHRQRYRAHRIAVLQRRLRHPRLLPARTPRSRWRSRRSPPSAQTLLRIFPPGTTPPNILKYDASSVPILQLGLESKTLSEQELFDLGQNFIRTPARHHSGRRRSPALRRKIPPGDGRSQPATQLYAKRLSPVDVSNALTTQNLILPAGDAKIGDIDYQVKLNSSPRVLDEMNNLPIKVVNGATVYLGDVAQVRDGYAVQTSIVRTNGTRGALLTVLRNGKASTLAIVNNVKAAAARDPGRTALPSCTSASSSINPSSCAPPSTAWCAKPSPPPSSPALMILLFLGSWRSTAHRLHLHSAFDPGLAHRSQPARARPST